VVALESNLFSAVPSDEKFDVIISSPPSFPGEPYGIADRAWHAGPNYRDIAMLFEEARERIAPDGVMYLLLSSDSDLELLGKLINRAGFSAIYLSAKSIFVESFIIYELRQR
jgi:23S rRNA G2069 N7-methylase RlmK/C1962 C5-methylase RlmI